MKKLLSILFAILVFNTASVQAQQRIKFYYYPATNVYYNTTTGQYAYNDNGTWSTAKALPKGMTVRNQTRQVVYDNTPQVWVNNGDHITRYKTNGKARANNNPPNGKAIGHHKSAGKGKAKGKN